MINNIKTIVYHQTLVVICFWVNINPIFFTIF